MDDDPDLHCSIVRFKMCLSLYVCVCVIQGGFQIDFLLTLELNISLSHQIQNDTISLHFFFCALRI